MCLTFFLPPHSSRAPSPSRSLHPRRRRRDRFPGTRGTGPPSCGRPQQLTPQPAAAILFCFVGKWLCQQFSGTRGGRLDWNPLCSAPLNPWWTFWRAVKAGAVRRAARSEKRFLSNKMNFPALQGLAGTPDEIPPVFSLVNESPGRNPIPCGNLSNSSTNAAHREW